MQFDRSGKLPNRLVYTIATLLTLLIAVSVVPIFAGSQGYDTSGTQVTVKQDPGKTVYWVLPGKRELSKEDFGTPADPINTGEIVMNKAKGPVKDLLEKLPVLVGVPVDLREVNDAGTAYTTTSIPTPFGDNGRIVKGQFRATFTDRQPYDNYPGNSGKDALDASVQFSDPQGNEYTIRFKKLIQPPIPYYESGGGIITNTWHHGNTGTGTPLMPRVYTYAASWSLADVMINGKVADRNKVVHIMTTQTVRDKDYHLVTENRLPLSKDETIAGQIHETHLIVLPITVTDQGPKYAPVKSAFTLPNGKQQPFIHIMYEQDQIVHAPFIASESMK